MKEINTNQMLETKVRIYNTYLLNRLSAYYEKHRKSFKNKNDLYLHLIQSGLELEETCDENYEDYNGKIQSISEKLTEILNAIRNESAVYKENLSEQIIISEVTEKMLAKIYHMLLGLSEELPLERQYVEDGFYDYLPKDIRKRKKEMSEFLGKKTDENVGEK